MVSIREFLELGGAITDVHVTPNNPRTDEDLKRVYGDVKIHRDLDSRGSKSGTPL